MATRKVTSEQQAEAAAAPATGGAAGIATGAAIGAMAGGPMGAAVGAAIGGPIGAAIGTSVNYSEAEPHFRQHWENGPYKAITRWEDVSPAYKYGFESAGKDEYRGKSYDEIGPTLRKGWKHKAKYDDVEPMIRNAWESRSSSSSSSSAAIPQGATTAGKTHMVGGEREAVVPVVEEELQVGKRKVEKGGVKVKTRVTETPVEENVHLHEEHVKVERRPANRAATAGDAAFKETTLDLKETAEEAVVAKTARVVEEVVIRKEGSDRTETVKDKVRRTDVDVEKTAGKAKSGPVEWEKVAPKFEKDFHTRYGKTGSSFEQYTPAYRFGYTLGADPDYQGEWDEVEPEARKHWEEKNKGTWQDYQEAVHHAWEILRNKRK